MLGSCPPRKPRGRTPSACPCSAHSVATWRRMLDVGRARPTDPSYHGCCPLSVSGSVPFGTHVTDWKVGRIMSLQVAQASPSKLEGVARIISPKASHANRLFAVQLRLASVQDNWRQCSDLFFTCIGDSRYKSPGATLGGGCTLAESHWSSSLLGVR